jgi:hypothetical protein
MRRIGLVVLLFACGKPDTLSRSDCIRIRDHVAELVTNDLVAHPEALWDAHDPSHDDGVDPGLTRATFGAFLKTERGQQWIARSRARAAATMDDLVDLCVKKAKQANLDCWLAATTPDAFAKCPDPSSKQR